MGSLIKFTVLLLSFSLFLTGCSGQLPIKDSITNDSGVYVVNSSDSSIVDIYLIFKRPLTGEFPAGMAHYAEHLVWNNMSDDVASNLSHKSNAWTSDLSIGYWLSGPKENLSNMLVTIAKVFDPIIASSDFAAKELDIVKREYDLRVVDSIDWQAHAAIDRFIYKNNAIANSTIGTPESISELTYSDAKEFHQASHAIDESVLLVVGQVSDQSVFTSLKKAGIPATSFINKTKLSPMVFQLAEPEVKTFTLEADGKEPRVTYRKIVALDNPVEFDLLSLQTQLLSSILGANLPGGIAGPLRYDEFIARSFDVAIVPLDEQHIELYVLASPDKGVSLNQLQSSVEAVLAESAKGIPVATFDRVRKRKANYFVDAEDDAAVEDWMPDYVRARVASFREPKSLSELKKLDDQLVLTDLNLLLKALQQPGRQAVAFINNNNGDIK